MLSPRGAKTTTRSRLIKWAGMAKRLRQSFMKKDYNFKGKRGAVVTRRRQNSIRRSMSERHSRMVSRTGSWPWRREPSLDQRCARGFIEQGSMERGGSARPAQASNQCEGHSPPGCYTALKPSAAVQDAMLSQSGAVEREGGGSSAPGLNHPHSRGRSYNSSMPREREQQPPEPSPARSSCRRFTRSATSSASSAKMLRRTFGIIGEMASWTGIPASRIVRAVLTRRWI